MLCKHGCIHVRWFYVLQCIIVCRFNTVSTDQTTSQHFQNVFDYFIENTRSEDCLWQDVPVTRKRARGRPR